MPKELTVNDIEVLRQRLLRLADVIDPGHVQQPVPETPTNGARPDSGPLAVRRRPEHEADDN